MKSKFLAWMTLAFCSAALCLQAADEITNSDTGVAFPKQISFDFDKKSYNLTVTGTATRKKYLVKIYAVAHYLQDGAAITGNQFEQMLTDDRAKQLTFKWVRGLTAEQIKEGYEESLKTPFPSRILKR